MTHPRRTSPYVQAAILCLSALIPAFLHPRPSHAQQPGEKVIQLPVGGSLFGGTSLQLRAGVSHTPSSDFGALLQPRFDGRSDYYGHFFAVAATTSGVKPGVDQTAPTAFDLAGSGNVKQLYGGWSSGHLFGALGEDALTLSIGRETFGNGNGTLMFGAGDSSCDTDCWLQRRSSRFNSMAAKLKTGPLQGRVFYLESDQSKTLPALGGISASASASALSVGGSYAEMMPRNDPSTSSEGAYGLLGASYKLAGLLPWSPTVSYGYSFVSGTPDALVDDGAHPISASSVLAQSCSAGPLQYLSGNSMAQIGLTLQPTQNLKLGASYANQAWDSRVQGLDLSAEWKPKAGLSLGMQGGIAEADPELLAPDATSHEARLAGTLKVAF
jgi:hypothetical protein